MMEQKERHLDVTNCHRCNMRQSETDGPVECLAGQHNPNDVSWLSDGAYAIIPETAPQICQILSIGYRTMTFVYFSKTPFAAKSLSSAEIVVSGEGFIADHIPFKVVSDLPLEDDQGASKLKRICKVEILALNNASKVQIDHVIALKEVMTVQ